MCRWPTAIALCAALCATPAHATTARLNGTDLLAQSGCPSPTEVEAIATVLHYMKSHPDELGNDAVSLVHLALEEAFDCKRRPLGLWDALGH